MFYWIYDHPPLIIATLFAFLFASTTWAAMVCFRRFFSTWFHSESRGNDLLIFAISSFFVLYGILLGLLAVATYTNTTAVNDIVTKEAGSLAVLYGDLHGLPDPMRGRLQNQLRDYTRNLIERTWPQQRQGIVSNEGTHQLTQIMDDLMTYSPMSKGDEIIYAEILHQVNTVLDVRRERLASIGTAIPAVLWWVVGLGAVISIVLIAMLDIAIHVHTIVANSLSVFLASMIFAIAVTDNPFRGKTGVGSDAIQEVYETVMKTNTTLSESMAALTAELAKLGVPRLVEADGAGNSVGTVPDLYFGSVKMNGRFDEIDRIASKDPLLSATIFVKSGDQFVRVATTIRHDDNKRALGTKLDPNGPVISQIRKGRAYYGEATILGKPYVTDYEPIFDADNKIIGICYIGLSHQ